MCANIIIVLFAIVQNGIVDFLHFLTGLLINESPCRSFLCRDDELILMLDTTIFEPDTMKVTLYIYERLKEPIRTYFYLKVPFVIICTLNIC